MTLRARKHAVLLATALAVLAALLTGCAITPTHYVWYRAAEPLEWYRFEQMPNGAGYALLCGRVAPDGYGAGGACVIRLNRAVIKPDDKNVATGDAYGRDGTGPLCLILSTVSEDAARRGASANDDTSLLEHELKHCRTGMDHELIHGRVQ